MTASVPGLVLQRPRRSSDDLRPLRAGEQTAAFLQKDTSITRNKDATNGAPGIATRSKDATNGAPGHTTRNKKLLVQVTRGTHHQAPAPPEALGDQNHGRARFVPCFGPQGGGVSMLRPEVTRVLSPPTCVAGVCSTRVWEGFGWRSFLPAKICAQGWRALRRRKPPSGRSSPFGAASRNALWHALA